MGAVLIDALSRRLRSAPFLQEHQIKIKVRPMRSSRGKGAFMKFARQPDRKVFEAERSDRNKRRTQKEET